ncbi:Winged helix-turn-helix transcriptional regulator [Sulfidibacter corallicola]|uniref:Winged helix-turn-helix transcriptional regulator n=1 Tax=Sulfidibacter corallicola TaxID=2818388 RepID=A0A8A4U4T2_SULCO|nr:winged helix-turn-helix transcriptional regulator [Sulfidibacter corallicola]QTD53755.1 winged helix-turn-helix transcriptional regulator [Sulfidibacter corallicola]
MGKLRTEPKVKPLVTDAEYKHYLSILQEAQSCAKEHHVYWDLEDGENPSKIRKGFMYVAEKEDLPVVVRRERGTRSLSFSFKEGEKVVSNRMSAKESRGRIVSALEDAGRPLQKSDIISATSISPSTWNIRIKELIDEGVVSREGDRRDTKYSLIKK